MDIKEIVQKLAPSYWKRDQWNLEYFDSVGFAEALIESYKAELLKEVGEPVLYAEFAEDGGWLGAASEYQDHLEEPHALYTSDQVAAAIAKATKPLEDQLTKAEQLWQIAQGRCDGLEEKLAKAEPRVAEACSKLCGSIAETSGHHGATDCESAIDSGEWRKFVKDNRDEQINPS